MTITPFPRSRPVRFRMPRTVGALFIREMETTNGRAAGGYLWALAEPIAGVLLLSLVFSLALRAPSVGTNFALFYASGYLPFAAYVELGQKVSVAVRFSKQLLAYPAVTYMDALLARFLLNALTQCMVFIIVIAGLIIIFDLNLILDLPAIALGVLMAFWLALGVGTLNCFLLSMFPVWERTWAILTRPLFFISGVFFVYDTIPMPYRDWLWWNPLIHVVGQVRDGIYVTYDASYVSPAYVFVVGGVTFTLGLILLRRYHRDILNI